MGIRDSEEEIVYHFFAETENIGADVTVIAGPDVNHIKNVLRMKPGERLTISDGKGLQKLCEIAGYEEKKVILKNLPEPVEDTELPARIYLFQGLPKSDKMELIIQKAVELGVHAVVPVDTMRTVVRLDAKKEEAKRKRWSSISESAAKQSGRMYIPEILPVMSFKDALRFADGFDLKVIPYEAEGGSMEKTRTLFKSLEPGGRAAVFIGPEGGFDEAEIAMAGEDGGTPVTLGERILRTETAGLFVLSALGLLLEE